MHTKPIFLSFCASILSISLLASCGSKVTPPTATLEVVQSSSNAYVEDQASVAATTKILNDADAAKLKLKGVIIEHTFSNKQKIRFQNIANHAVGNTDVAIADTEKLPEYIEFTEKEIAKGIKVAPQSITLNPYGCSGYFIGCINPTSNYLWTRRFIPFVFDSSMSLNQQNAFTNSVASWNAKPNQTVIWQSTTIYGGSDRPVRIYSVDAGGSTTSYCGQAYIGYQGRVVTAPFKQDFININNNSAFTCFTDRTIHHEMGHVIGLPHEQTRCDRDQFITIAPVANEGANCGNDFTTWNRPFDFASIMLYDEGYITPKRNASGVYIGSSYYTGNPNAFIRNEILSPVDIIVINNMYAGR